MGETEAWWCHLTKRKIEQPPFCCLVGSLFSSQPGSNSEPKEDENKDCKVPTVALPWCCRSLATALGEKKPCESLYLLRIRGGAGAGRERE